MIEPISPPDLDRVLRDRFGIAAFHPWQREAIDALLRPPGRVLLVAPTGGGKSLCYQLPAVALQGVTLVLSPLISLMEDQVRALLARGIPATFIASSLPREENGRRLAGMRAGDYKIVYAAPERLVSEGFIDALAHSRLALCAIDEAHCIVQWGHDFRPDYMRIGALLDRLRPERVLACTATATPDARDEIVRQLKLGGDDLTVVLRGFARPNLHLAVREVSGPRDAARETAAALARALGSARAPAGAAIVYTATRKGAEKLAEQLAGAGWNARPYHAGLAAETRAQLSAAFAERQVPVVVATNAFGMGIDRADVRAVIHAQPPGSIEGYYQEVGRAGRDGAPAHGLLLFTGADITLRRRLCMNGDAGAPAAAADAARAWSLFRELLRYLDAASCRHDFILRYFGDEAESLGGCGHCDVCLEVDELSESDPEALDRDADIARRALAGVARAKGGAGLQAIAGMLRGDASGRVSQLRLDKLSTFGVLSGRTQEELTGILRALIAAGLVDLTTGDFPVPFLTEMGWRVMRAQQPARLVLPRAVAPKPKKPRSRFETTSRRDAASGASGGGSGAAPAPAVAAGNGALFEALRARRAEVAKEQGVPAYVVAHDRTLVAIADARPRSRADLAAIRGMGPWRIEHYGDWILSVVGDAAEPRAGEAQASAPP